MAYAPTFSAPAGQVRGQAWAGALLGLVFTVGLFLGIARIDRVGQNHAPAEVMDVHAVSLQEPPPPREVPQEPAPTDILLTGFDAAPSDSPVQIAVTPPDLRDLLPPQVAPPAVIQVGLLYANLKPKMDINVSVDHIYQMMEVDQLPRVLNRVIPMIPASVRQGAQMMRTSLLFIVDIDGAIKDVRIASSSGNAEFDTILLHNIREWSFSPALRHGAKVRCLLQQAVIIKWNGGSTFEL